MAEAAIVAGHEITLLHRGHSDDPLFEGVEQLRADRNENVEEPLAGREFDATVDVCAYVPRHVRSLAKALDGRGGHHVFISTMSVYADADGPGLNESAKLVRLADTSSEEVTGETYGGLKVLCEEAAESAYNDDLTIIRPTYVIGPHDHTGRFTWWVRRIARGDEVLAPGPTDSPIQVIDARDQATWVVSLTESRKAGIYNSVSPTPPFGLGDLLDATVRAVGPSDTRLTWADAAWLSERGETHQSLPLWNEGSDEWTLAADPARSFAAGLSPRALTQTITDTWDWIQEAQPPLVQGWGISAEREAELLSSWRAR